MQKKFVANKAVLVNAQGEILLVRDTGKLDHAGSEGKLDFPGGRMDAMETPHEGLLRELQEELGLTQDDVQVGVPIHVGLWSVKGDFVNDPIVGIFYVVRLIGNPEIVLSAEHSEYVWVDPKQALPIGFGEGITKVIHDYKESEGIVIASDASIKGRQGYGLVQVFTGNGKGKTTASLGESIRAVGAGKRVGIVFFDKGGETHYFERQVLASISGIQFIATGRDRIDPVSGRFDFSLTDVDAQEAQRGLREVERLFLEGVDVVVMDEINSTTDLGIVSVEDVLAVLKKKPEQTELILTGRNAPSAFLDLAHLVTQMRLRKHYFYSGVKAREGLDY